MGETEFQEGKVVTECFLYIRELAQRTRGHGPYWDAIRLYLKSLLSGARSQTSGALLCDEGPGAALVAAPMLPDRPRGDAVGRQGMATVL